MPIGGQVRACGTHADVQGIPIGCRNGPGTGGAINNIVCSELRCAQSRGLESDTRHGNTTSTRAGRRSTRYSAVS